MKPPGAAVVRFGLRGFFRLHRPLFPVLSGQEGPGAQPGRGPEPWMGGGIGSRASGGL